MGLYFEQFEIGREWLTPSRTITETDVVNFCGASGDFHPLHSDEEYSRRTPFGGRIAHGPLILGIAHGLTGRLGFLDETGLALMGFDSVRFTGPVKIGDTIAARVTVADKTPSSKGGRGTLRLRVSVINQKVEEVAAYEMLALVKTAPAD